MTFDVDVPNRNPIQFNPFLAAHSLAAARYTSTASKDSSEHPQGTKGQSSDLQSEERNNTQTPSVASWSNRKR
ncbi:hypothetical protein E2C01_036586 [Portunus trituberculatus]|uniref:Uncharacterized protein n=1 Tax=Portunus trituberculatus TaxID=210409 RepID=A0A5B7F725_PORTR|nr:hypothetical protein [Portunus trituberculatus]